MLTHRLLRGEQGINIEEEDEEELRVQAHRKATSRVEAHRSSQKSRATLLQKAQKTSREHEATDLTMQVSLLTYADVC
jgi:hypothetical protein